MLNIDFFADARAYKGNNSTPTPVTPIKPVEPSVIVCPQNNNDSVKAEPLELFPENSGLAIAEDCKTLTYKGVSYIIPDYYNKKMIAKRDKKTIEMVLISLDLDYGELALK